jgi:hypothetical protein
MIAGADIHIRGENAGRPFRAESDGSESEGDDEEDVFHDVNTASDPKRGL